MKNTIAELFSSFSEEEKKSIIDLYSAHPESAGKLIESWSKDAVVKEAFEHAPYKVVLDLLHKEIDRDAHVQQLSYRDFLTEYFPSFTEEQVKDLERFCEYRSNSAGKALKELASLGKDYLQEHYSFVRLSNYLDSKVTIELLQRRNQGKTLSR